jgi:amidase/aspartyl-tRNA(Asn)/glutamyl-tRNA(Gln) amidotransferase subunit A
MTRSVADAALMLEIISGRDLRDWNQPPVQFPPIALSEIKLKGKRIGYWRTPCVGQVQSQVAAVTDRVVAALGDWGAAVTVISLPFQEELLDVFNRHWCVGAANRLAQIDPTRHSDLDPGFIKAARIGASFTSIERMAAEVRRSQYGAAMDRLLSDFDYILSPTVPVQPFEAGSDVPCGSGVKSWPEWSSFSFPINLSQQPACSVPCGLSEDGLPIGLQIIGGRGEDSSVLSFALAYEQMYPERFIRSNENWKSLQESTR